jgi:protein tyrosine/serine phosphatase
MQLAATATLLALAVAPIGCATRGFPPIAGIDNFDTVDAHVKRGAQPNTLALAKLADNYPGLTVLNLRADPWQLEASECDRLGLRYISLPWSGLRAPSHHQVDEALAVIATAPGPVFIHCQAGCDRTGTLVACYRIRHGAANATALNDAILHGLSPFEPGMRHLISTFK